MVPCPNWDHIELGFSQLQLSFDEQTAKPGYMWVPLETTYMYFQALSEGDETGEQGKERIERFDELLSRVMQHRKLLLLPICRANHYTLLAVSREVSGVEVRYYDGLHEVSQECWKTAEILCHKLALSMPAVKTNVSPQIGAECGICVLQWTEGELRKLHGEDLSIIGWPDESRMRDIRKRIGA